MEGTPQLLKGINYGVYSFENDTLVASKDNKVLMKLPLSKISNSSVVNKQDVSLEFQVDEGDGEDMLCEMRLYIPPNADKNEEKDGKIDDEENEEKEDKEDEEEEGKEEGKKKEKAKTSAEILNSVIVGKANISQTAGDVIVSFSELPFIVPRGKYSCDLSANSLRLHGATFNHIIQYKNINRAFLLPKPDDVHMLFVLGLDKPLRQGNTTYPYLVMQIKKETEEEVKIKLPPEQIAEQYGDKLKETYEGALYDTVAKVFKSIIKVNIVIPGDFQSSTKESGIKCSVRASEGHLFFLIKSLIFVPKPVIYIKNDDLKGVEFHRLGSGAQIKMFDMTLQLKGGQTYSFSGIDKKELEIIMEYFNSRKISVKTVSEKIGFINEKDLDDESDDGDKGGAGDLDDEESEDEDFIAGEESEEDEEEDGDFDEEEEEEKPKKGKKK